MNIVNERVEHIMFGTGVITEINDNKIQVQFQNEIGSKTFIYPDAFEKFLKAVNPIVENDVMEEWYRKRERIEKERETAEKEDKNAGLPLTIKKSATRVKKKKTNN